MNIGVLLSGCGVYDGAEIQEAVLTLLAIEEIGAKAICISVDSDQHHVINHLTGEEMPENRNIMIESARIARGNVIEISQIAPADLDALVIPGGFGSAKNFTDWAFKGNLGEIDPKIKLLLVNMHNAGKPIVALCVSPVVLAKALEDSNHKINVTIGTNLAPSPYDITAFAQGIEKTGAKSTMRSIDEIQIDDKNRVISAPCYMMESNILEVRNNIQKAIKALNVMLKETLVS